MDASNLIVNAAIPCGLGVTFALGIDLMAHGRYKRRPRDEGEDQRMPGDIFDRTFTTMFIAAVIMVIVLIIAAMVATANHGDTKEQRINQDIRECVERDGMPSVKATNWDGTEYEFGGCLLP